MDIYGTKNLFTPTHLWGISNNSDVENRNAALLNYNPLTSQGIQIGEHGVSVKLDNLPIIRNSIPCQYPWL